MYGEGPSFNPTESGRVFMVGGHELKLYEENDALQQLLSLAGSNDSLNNEAELKRKMQLVKDQGSSISIDFDTGIRVVLSYKKVDGQYGIKTIKNP